MTVPTQDAIFIDHANLADGTISAWRADDLFQTVRDGALKVTIDRRFPLKAAGKAMAYLEARKSKGKLLLDL